jgi:hypothetical protein
MIFACVYALIAAVKLYRGYAGVMPSSLVTLSTSGAATLSKTQRWANAVFGICFLALAVRAIYLSRLFGTLKLNVGSPRQRQPASALSAVQ